jgi:hypothetical protein
MSEYELLDVMNSHMNMALFSFSAYLTIVFGFLVASYLVANRLKKVEIIIISSLFSFGALIQTYGGVAHLIRQYLFAEMAKQRLPDLIWFHSVTAIVIMGIVMLSGIVASLYFMYSRIKQS